MPSPESKAQYNLLKAIGERFGAHPELVQDVATMRNIFDSLQNLSAEPTDVTYEDISVSTSSRSIPAQWAKPLNASKNHVILYAHGGGFITNSPGSHRKLVGHLAKASGCLALSIDYRLAPEHRFPSQLDDCVAVYDWLVKEKQIKPEHIATVGTFSFQAHQALTSPSLPTGRRLSRRQSRDRGGAQTAHAGLIAARRHRHLLAVDRHDAVGRVGAHERAVGRVDERQQASADGVAVLGRRRPRRPAHRRLARRLAWLAARVLGLRVLGGAER